MTIAERCVHQLDGNACPECARCSCGHSGWQRFAEGNLAIAHGHVEWKCRHCLLAIWRDTLKRVRLAVDALLVEWDEDEDPCSDP